MNKEEMIKKIENKIKKMKNYELKKILEEVNCFVRD